MDIWIYGPGPVKGYADAISARPYFCLKYGFLRIGCDVAVGSTKRPNEKCSTAAYYFNKLSYGFRYFHLNRKKGSYYFFYDIARKKKKKTEKEPNYVKRKRQNKSKIYWCKGWAAYGMILCTKIHRYLIKIYNGYQKGSAKWLHSVK